MAVTPLQRDLSISVPTKMDNVNRVNLAKKGVIYINRARQLTKKLIVSHVYLK